MAGEERDSEHSCKLNPSHPSFGVLQDRPRKTSTANRHSRQARSRSAEPSGEAVSDPHLKKLYYLAKHKHDSRFRLLETVAVTARVCADRPEFGTHLASLQNK